MKKLFRLINKHKLIIISILIFKVLFLIILKNYLFSKPLAVHMKIESRQMTKHILN